MNPLRDARFRRLAVGQALACMRQSVADGWPSSTR
jgi:hypothetical protein